MREIEYRLPFSKIKYGERIIIYGAGRVGRSFLRQIRMTGYCEIIAVADRDYSRYKSEYFPIIAPEQIPSFHYDKILLAVKSKEAIRSINEKLSALGVQGIAIINGLEPDDNGIEFYNKQELLFLPNLEAVCYRSGISIAVYLSGGLGDDIITKHFLEAFIKHIKCTESIIDFYVPRGKMEYAQAVFSGCRFVNRIFYEERPPQELKTYNIVLRLDYILKLFWVDYEALEKKDAELCQFIRKLKSYIQQWGLDADIPLHRGIHFARCKVLGRNCYTDYSTILGCTGHNVNIPLQQLYKEKYKNLKLSQYITINFGWGGKRCLEPDKLPNKVWPIKYYEEFNRIFKEKCPNISIVQIGIDNSYMIEGVDCYVFGEHIETVKYILKESMLHIDCEGGLVHMATQLGTKCIVIFGPTPKHYFGYEENINLSAGNCHDCYYLHDDFSICARGQTEPDCMKAVTPDMVMESAVGYFEECNINTFTGKEW